MPKRVFITVAEVSGDQHAAQLVRSLRTLDPSLAIEGIGGPLMRNAGCMVHHETVKHAAMGLHGAKRYFEVKRILAWTKHHFARHKPDLQIGVDSPDMNIHFAKLAKSLGTPVMQYVAPQTWAWREYRLAKFRRWVDHIACILPFEEQYFRERNVRATFVGHPLFDELPARVDRPNNDRFPNRPPVIGLMPGSRRSEAEGNFPPMLKVMRLIQREFPEAQFLVSTVAATHSVIEAHLRSAFPRAENGNAFEAGMGAPTLRYAIDSFDEMVPQCDLCVVASGTATLHVAGFHVPMVVVYRASWYAWNLLGRWLSKTRTFSLVNLLSENRRHIVPEHIPWYGEPEPVAGSVLELLKDPQNLESMRRQISDLVNRLDHPGASDNAARLALSLIR